MKKLICLLVFGLITLSAFKAHAATLYAKAAGGNWSAAGTWSTTGSGGGDSSGPPTAADNVILESGSGNVTINSTAVCRSLDTTSGTGSFGGTLTHSSGVTLSIGDATAGAGNVALKLNSGMTYTLGSATTSATTFKTTSATQQTITTAGKTLGNVVINGVGSSYQLADALTSSGSFTYTAGSVFDTNTKAITLSGSSSAFAGGGMTYYELDLTGSGTASVTGANTFTNFNRTGTASKICALSFSGDQTISGTFTLAGNSATNRLLLISSVMGTTRTITNTGATETWSNVDFRDIAMAESYDASAITGLSGDCGGNSGITFTTGATQYWFKNTGSWSDASKWFLATGGGGGAGHVPLPQDDVRFDATAFDTGSQTITQDMPRMGKTINMTSMDSFPTFNFNTIDQSLYGGMTLIASMTFTTGQDFMFDGRGDFNLTTANVTNSFASSNIIIRMVGGSLTLQNNITAITLTLLNGTLNANNKNLNLSVFASTGTATRTINMGSGTWTLSGTGQLWGMAGDTTATVNADTSTVIFTGSSSSARYFAGGIHTYNNIKFQGTGTGVQTIDKGCTFNDITLIAGQNFQILDSSLTTTITGELISRGTSSSNISWSTNVSPAIVSKASGFVICDYCSISNITGQGGAKYFAFRSTNGGGNTGWKFRKRTVSGG